MNRVSACLVLFFLTFALSIDLFWLRNHDRLPELAEAHWMARIYRDYATADRAYYDRASKLEIGLETLNVYVTPVAYVLLLFGMARRRPWRYSLQLAVGSWVSYSVLLDLWIAAIRGYPGMQQHTLANFFKLYASNAPWLLGHLYLAADAVRAILRAMRAVEAEDAHREQPVRRVPTFESATNLRQKARAAGLDPNYWYPVEHEAAVRQDKPVETMFWNEPIVLFRDADGAVAAIENRCAHRQVKLSLGEVHGCSLVCAYHGWKYDCDGRVQDIPHDLFGREMPRFQVKSYPVRVRYGLVWIFPGDPRRASETAMPEIPELEGSNQWACIPFSFVWRAHHSIIIDNLSDLSHGYLHRDRQAFADPVLLRHELEGDRVYCQYRVRLLEGPLMKKLLDRSRSGMDMMELCFQYPYQWGNSAESVKHWILMLPVDERTTRIFFLFYFNHIRIPFTPFYFSQRMMRGLLRLVVPLFIKPLVSQDGEAVDWEQQGYERHFDAPLAELCPAVPMFQRLVVRKWEEHLASRRPRAVGAVQS